MKLVGDCERFRYAGLLMGLSLKMITTCLKHGWYKNMSSEKRGRHAPYWEIIVQISFSLSSPRRRDKADPMYTPTFWLESMSVQKNEVFLTVIGCTLSLE